MRLVVVADIPSLSAWIKKFQVRRLGIFWRRHPDLNWGIGVLQTRALPLGYSAIFNYKKMERMTRLELATSTLARWRSTR